jgi:SAM-dependent methyltransferase
MNNYIFDDNQRDRELRRLRRIEAALDPQTHQLLCKTGVSTGWKCLEVGAGGGSILQWLGERVGVGGQAVGVDKKIEYLAQFQVPPFEVINGDVLEVNRAAAFDLIHVRYVLIHNRNSVEILAHLTRLLKPGGYLVLEEPDFEAAEWIDEEYGAAGQRVNRAIWAMFSGISLDPGFGKRLPPMASHSGLRVSHVEVRSHLEPGGGPVAMVMADSTEALRDKYTSTGEASSADVDRYIHGARDPKSWALYYSTVGVVASNSHG